MAGDVNLFISERHDEDEVEVDSDVQRMIRYDAELEVMIAGEFIMRLMFSFISDRLSVPEEPSYRRRGLAKEALAMLMHYATTRPKRDSVPSQYLPLAPDAFVAKIGVENAPSIALFQRLGFHEVRRSEIWREAELRPIAQDAIVTQVPLQYLHWPQK
jgi:GNAT superfamily N-acetyltransferase